MRTDRQRSTINPPIFRVLGVIPARGGSKGVLRKNVRLLAGKPLLQYTAEAALRCKHLSRVVLTTDDPEIAEVGRRCGLEVPFLRPAELARDDAPTLPVLQHAVRQLEQEGDRFEMICLLQPTNPLRGPDMIAACLDLLESSGADSVVTVLPVPPEYNPHWVYFRNPEGFLHPSTGELVPIPRRQLLPPAFHREGSVYAMRRDILMVRNSLFGDHIVGFEMQSSHSVNIDTEADFERAEAMLRGTACPGSPQPTS
ncbi:MAG: acylneuraminate cytidylyltransferase family protein [Acidobacteria bacterium]|nr:acylneuraminate cytidylyltransferase family protein [Acidobacteriota bacterium]